MFIINGNNFTPANSKEIVISPDGTYAETTIQKVNITSFQAEPYLVNTKTWRTGVPFTPNMKIHIIENNSREHIIDLTLVENQPTWFTTAMTPVQQQAGLKQAISDLYSWI